MTKSNLYIYIFIVIGISSGLLSHFSKFNTDTLVLMTSVILPVICLFSLIKSNVFKKIGVKKFIILGIILFSLEIIGAKTGIIYGDFKYSTLFKPQILGTPIVMFFVWATLVVESYSLSSVFNKKLIKLLITGVLLVIADLIIDPGAVKMGLWSWLNSGPWYGIPWSNYIGWLILGTIGAAILYKRDTPNNLFVPPFFLSYIISFWSIYNLMNGMFLTSIIGLVFLFTIILIQVNLNKFNNSI